MTLPFHVVYVEVGKYFQKLVRIGSKSFVIVMVKVLVAFFMPNGIRIQSNILTIIIKVEFCTSSGAICIC